MKRLSYILFVAYCILCVPPNLFGQRVYNEVVGEYIEPEEALPVTLTIVAEKLDSQGEQELVVLRDGIDLSRRNLRNVSINNRKLKNVDFSYSDLTNADLRLAIFENCNFSHTILDGMKKNDYTEFRNCNFDSLVRNTTYQERNSIFFMKETPIIESLAVMELLKNGGDVDSSLIDGVSQDASNSDKETDSLYIPARLDNRFTTREQLVKSINYRDKIFHNCRIGKELYGDKAKSSDPNLSFSGLDFSNAVFFNCRFEGEYDFENANFENAKFYDSNLSGNFTNANFENASFFFTSISGIQDEANFKNVKFEKTIHSGKYTNANFTNASFINSIILSKAYEANIENAKFVRLNMLPAESVFLLDQIKTTWNWKNDRMNEFSPKIMEKLMEETPQTEKTEERFEFNFPKK